MTCLPEEEDILSRSIKKRKELREGEGNGEEEAERRDPKGSVSCTMMKADKLTSIHSRGKFTRFCVEIDLSRRLPPKIKVLGRELKFEYEHLHLICFNCGKFVDKKDDCGEDKMEDMPSGLSSMPEYKRRGKGRILKVKELISHCQLNNLIEVLRRPKRIESEPPKESIIKKVRNPNAGKNPQKKFVSKDREKASTRQRNNQANKRIPSQENENVEGSSKKKESQQMALEEKSQEGDLPKMEESLQLMKNFEQSRTNLNNPWGAINQVASMSFVLDQETIEFIENRRKLTPEPSKFFTTPVMGPGSVSLDYVRNSGSNDEYHSPPGEEDTHD
ncbi:hypothetical protein RJT34_27112 [Clitoria ternatea]|uniref:Zinc knuckle CX2CX4HX4C domain-containing protein n=1 Tax=Clitoria ternatea TaxID=43366 RepID=A0AAN9FCJ9_CLITE